MDGCVYLHTPQQSILQCCYCDVAVLLTTHIRVTEVVSCTKCELEGLHQSLVVDTTSVSVVCEIRITELVATQNVQYGEKNGSTGRHRRGVGGVVYM